MYIKQQIYAGELTNILYSNDGKLLQHKETKLTYGSVSLKDGRKQEDYVEIEDKTPKDIE